MTDDDCTLPPWEIIPPIVMNQRHIKVQRALYSPLKTAKQTPRAVPLISIRGHWLQVAGFEIGQTARIYIMKGCLVFVTDIEAEEET